MTKTCPGVCDLEVTKYRHEVTKYRMIENLDETMMTLVCRVLPKGKSSGLIYMYD